MNGYYWYINGILLWPKEQFYIVIAIIYNYQQLLELYRIESISIFYKLYIVVYHFIPVIPLSFNTPPQ